MTINAFHIAMTPLAGSPIRIVNALRAHTGVAARLVVARPNQYGRRVFENDLVWDRDREEAMSLLSQADVVHLHHPFDLSTNLFGIDFTKCAKRGCRFVRQYHSIPMHLSHGDAALADAIVRSEIPQLVISQFHERFYPFARLVPNIVPVHDERYTPKEKDGGQTVLFFAPSVRNSAWESRWETKGYPETKRLMERLATEMTGVVSRICLDTPHDECLRQRRESHLAIDEMATGSFHLSSLEALSQGVPTFAWLDARTLSTLAEMTGANDHPWMNYHFEDAEPALRALILDRDLRDEIGRFSRQWMERRWNDRDMAGHYVRAYEDLLERPETFGRPRFDLAGKRATWLSQGAADAEWEAHRSRHLAAPDAGQGSAKGGGLRGALWRLKENWWPRGRLKALEARLARAEHLIELATDNPAILWLNKNREERMDATVGIYDERRRAVHRACYEFAAAFVAGKDAADIACGTGYGAEILCRDGMARSVVGVDNDAETIEYARKSHALEGVEFVCASADRSGIPAASVDVVVSFETIEHVPNDRALIDEFHRILRPGGTLICSTPNQWPAQLARHHVRVYDKAGFIEALSWRFTGAGLYNQNSGSDWLLNHGQPAGIRPATPENESTAECYIAICQKPTD